MFCILYLVSCICRYIKKQHIYNDDTYTDEDDDGDDEGNE